MMKEREWMQRKGRIINTFTILKKRKHSGVFFFNFVVEHNLRAHSLGLTSSEFAS